MECPLFMTDTAQSPRVFIFYDAVLDARGEQLIVGGVQTYLLSLADVVRRMGWDVIIVQQGERDFETEINGIVVHGHKISVRRHADAFRALFDRVQDEADPGKDLIVWGSFYFVPRLDRYKTISIQHGIVFDYLENTPRNNRLIRLRLGGALKYLRRREALKWFAMSDFRVCVDYNFLNWYRTFSFRHNEPTISVIPNFTDIPQEPLVEKQQFTKVLFARRFVERRGLLLMVEAAQTLLQQHSALTMTFAGEGPLRPHVEALQARHGDRVTITKYKPAETLEFHQQFDIAVVPTLGSEGTSLSLLEAMAAGCVVVCSNVGGMTNIVIDRFNGLMIPPRVAPLIEAVEQLVSSPALANRLRFAARSTVEEGFSKSLWAERWRRLLMQVERG